MIVTLGSVAIALSATASPFPARDAEPAAVIADAAPELAPDPDEKPSFDYVIVDLPPTARASRWTALDQPVDATRASAAADAETMPGDRAVTSIDDNSTGTQEAGRSNPIANSAIDQAVIAVHDERIRLIRQRLSAASAPGTAKSAAQLRDLEMRLQRAEAARMRAAQRMVGDPACCEAQVAAPAVTPPAQPLEPLSPARGMPRVASRPAEQNPANHGRIADQPREGSDRPVRPKPKPLLLTQRVSGPVTGQDALESAVDRVPPQAFTAPTDMKPVPEANSAERLQRARIHLATARRLLEDGPDTAPARTLMGDTDLSDPMLPSPATQLAIAIAILTLLSGAMQNGRSPILARR